MTTQFEAGNDYTMRSPCDHNCMWTYTVKRRSATNVWLEGEDGKTIRRRVAVFMGTETCKPIGSYSMAPTLSAA